MRHAIGCLLVAGLLVGVGLGCAGKRRPVYRASVNAVHVIFNPVPGGYSEPRRALWPAAGIDLAPDAYVAYRETIVDRQGRFGGSQDYYRRRVDSVRTGRGYR